MGLSQRGQLGGGELSLFIFNKFSYLCFTWALRVQAKSGFFLSFVLSSLKVSRSDEMMRSDEYEA